MLLKSFQFIGDVMALFWVVKVGLMTSASVAPKKQLKFTRWRGESSSLHFVKEGTAEKSWGNWAVECLMQ